MAYKPKYVYTITDPTKTEGQEVVETIHADLMIHSEFPALIFRDDRNRLVAIHHMARGHTVSYTDRDGYTVQERRDA